MTANLLDFDLEGLTGFCERLGEKRFRAVQLFRWIHQKGASDFDAMSDLAKSLREKLKGSAQVKALAVLSQQISSDGTIKWLFDVGGGDAVEAVFIPEDDRGTLCISSQAGCAMGCRFCSPGIRVSAATSRAEKSSPSSGLRSDSCAGICSARSV